MSKISELLKLKDYITLTGTTLGLIAVMLVTIGGRTLISWGFFLLAFTFGTDLLDGYLARKTGTVNEIGKELDSLNDSLTFGIAPAVLTFQAFRNGTFYDYILMIGCIIFALGGILRLARFNISKEKEYMGVPTPLSGLVILTYFYANYFYAVASYDLTGIDLFPIFSNLAIAIIMAFLGWTNITTQIKMGAKDKDKKVYITFLIFAPLCPIFGILGFLFANFWIGLVSCIIFFIFTAILLGFIVIKLIFTQIKKKEEV
ncbi:MAG: hypothetical protein EU547_02785 [Promethearchaeota archaeon]|nr:MAG: hypothetical protein EU547_02785 [Candidatus Lokiarchaeota archaeon]